MFNPGDIIDGKFRVEGVCSEAGGMGAVLHVSPLAAAPECRIVLKYCRDSDEEQLRRFRREVRLLGSFKGNSKVVQIVDHNLDHDPPYFVMKYYPDGDLFNRAATLRNSYAAQEECFLQMIDCIQELHSRNEYHRDIKPRTFFWKGAESSFLTSVSQLKSDRRLHSPVAQSGGELRDIYLQILWREVLKMPMRQATFSCSGKQCTFC